MGRGGATPALEHGVEFSKIGFKKDGRRDV